MAIKKKRDLSAGFSPVPTNAIGSSPNQSNVLGGTPPLGRRNATPTGENKPVASAKPVAPTNLRGIKPDPGIGNEPLFIGNRQVSAQEFTNQLEASRLIAEGGRAAAKAIIPPDISQLGMLTPEQASRSAATNDEALSAGTALAAGVGGAIAGATAGTIALPGIGTAIGAIAGGVGGFFGKISVAQRGNVKEAYTVYKGSKSNMAWIINQVNAGTMTSFQANEMWNEELSNFYAAERNIKAETGNSLDRFLSGGIDEARQIEAFKRRLPQLQLDLEIALLNPDPNKIINFPEDMTTVSQ